ncbi:hypothetical protein LPJ78_003943 [Coemansia sp. RSA 989]|nr:hypothetical protein LPJ78_003943 [Coemansia sp. RSA 989]KAJ1871466.1 hypothetical protein LPJ55_003887 [Coemansia sp. RSA 990]
MFTSPSVRVRRRQATKPTRAEALGSESVTSTRSLKRSSSTIATVSHASLKKENSSSTTTQPTDQAADSLAAQTLPRKKQVTEAKRPVWLAPFAQQALQPNDTSNEHTTNSASQAALSESEAGLSAVDASKGFASNASKVDFLRASDPEPQPEADRVLLRGDKHAVFSIASFPEAVGRQLGSVDFGSVPIRSGVNSAGGFAFVATPTSCLVWPYDSASSAMTSRVYRLAMPDPDDTTVFETPLVALVSAENVQSDVGVLACSPTGQLRYWDRVAFGLGGTDRFYTANLDMPDASDRCERIIEVFSGLFVVATAKGYLFQVLLQDSQGATELNVHCLSKGAGSRTGMLSRMSSLLGGSQFAPVATDAGDVVVGIAGGERTEIRHSRELFVLTRQRLAKWVVSQSQPEKFMFSMDIVQTLSAAAAQRFDVDVDVEVDVYDIAAMRSGDICILAGLYTPQTGKRVQLVVGMLRGNRVSVEPEVVGLWPLKYAPDFRLCQTGHSQPQLVLPEGGPGMFAVFPKAIVGVVVSGTSAVFEEVVSFRDEGILGTSSAPQFPYASQSTSESSLFLTCAGAGVLQVCIDKDKVLASCAHSANAEDQDGEFISIETSAASWPGSGTRVGKASVTSSPEREYQTQIEQAVFFGLDNAHNPLSFAITSHVTGVDSALETAVLRVSQSILDNTSHFIVDRLDIGAHLNERLRHARAVMQFISEGALTPKLSHETRAHLCAHAEKLAAAVALWEYQNSVWAQKNGAASQLLANLIASFLESAGLQTSDPLRTFFRQHVAAIGDVLVFMSRNLAALRRALDDNESGRRDSQLISYEANRIIISILQPAFMFRFQNAALYAIGDLSDSPSTCERWTEHSAVVDLLMQRLEASYSLCREISGQHCASIYERISKSVLPNDEDPSDLNRSLSIFDDAISISHASLPDATEAPSSEEAKMRLKLDASPSLTLLRETIDQMGPLANLFFRASVDRISLLENTGLSEAHALVCRYEAARSRYIMCLVPLARASVAFRLAVEYRDLASLVMLVFATDSENAAMHLRAYTERFGRDFADVLFAYYEKRQAWASLLYTQDADFDSWLKRYVDSRMVENPHGPMAQIGWIHDVKMNDFGAAAAKLARAGRDSLEVDQARTMLSLSKLAFIAVEAENAVNDDTTQEAHSRLEDALEMCQIQESLSRYFTVIVRNNRDYAPELVWKRRDDVSDKKAVLDAAMLTTTSNCRHDFPALYTVFNELLRCIWNGRMLSVEDLVDVLTFPDNMSCIEGSSDDAEQYNVLVRERYSLAVDILSRASMNLSEQTREATLRTIWRRVFLSDDWPEIHQRIGGNVPDSELRQELECTRLYNVLQSCLATRELAHPDWYLLPIDSFATSDLDYLASTRLAPRFSSDVTPDSEWKPLSATTSPAVQKDYSAEDNYLRTAIKCNLGSYYSEILRMVTDQIAHTTRSVHNSSDMDAQASTETDSMMEFD